MLNIVSCAAHEGHVELNEGLERSGLSFVIFCDRDTT